MTKQVLWKGLVAGLVAGAVATLAKSVAERVYPPRVHGEPEPPDVLADQAAALGGLTLTPGERSAAAETLHWGFGLAAGAAYGALAEFYPAATAEGGAAFGLTLMSLTHEGALPALGLSAAPEDQQPREHRSEAATHMVYGVVAEQVRRLVRRALA